jgi:hypothetical protein
MSKDSKINLNVIDDCIPKIKMYSTDEEGLLNKIKNCLCDITECYKSKQSKAFLDSNFELCYNFSTINQNRKAYIKEIQTKRDQYEIVAIKNIRKFENLEVPSTKGKKND